MDDVILGDSGRRGAHAGSGTGPARVRVAPALLVVLLVAAVCPFVGSAQAAAAGGEIIELPEGFYPSHINDNGQIAGTYFDRGTPKGVAIWEDGELTAMPDQPSIVLGFNDRGEIVTRVQERGIYKLRYVTPDSTTFMNLPTQQGGSGRQGYMGWGPDSKGFFVAASGWDPGLGTNTWVSQNNMGFQPFTAITTSQAASDAGLLFGELPVGGLDPEYAVVDLTTGQTFGVAQGTQTDRTGAIDFGDGGHLLFSNKSGAAMWTKTERVEFGTEFSPWRVNGKGDVLGRAAPGNEPAIRYADGSVTSLGDLVGDTPGWSDLNDVRDINDNCDVIGLGRDAGGVQKPFLIKGNGCESVDIEGDFFRVDGGSAFVKIGDDADVRLRVDNASGKELTNVQVASVEVLDGAEEGKAELLAQGAGPPSTLDASGPGSVGFADYELKGTEAGKVTLKAEITATKAGEAVSGTIEREFEVRQDDLVVNLSLDPPKYTEAEDGTFTPVDITATVSFTNATSEDMTDIRLQELEVDRVFSGQELYVTYTSGIQPDPIDPEVIVAELKAGETSAEFTAVFTATENGEVEFSALATAASDGKTVAGIAKQRWKAKVAKFVEITTQVVSPPAGEMIDAGSPVTIDGTVENLSNSHRVTLGPLYPTLLGNTGTMNVGYDGNAANPTSPLGAEPMALEPGQRRTFQVRFTTNYSDPRMYEAQPSGGTRAYATFEPWGEAVEVQDPDAEGEPEVVAIRTYDEAAPGNGSAPGDEPDAQVKADPSDLFKRISIDDSIELPDRNAAAVAAGIMVGGVEGLANAAIAAIYSIPDIIKMPYSIMVAAYDYQAKVWESFTEEEKDLFLTETSFLIVSVLQRNVEFGLRDGKELYDQVYEMAGDHLTKTQNDWETGDYLATTQGYSAFMSETIGSVAGPVILSKMAQSPRAVAALERLQLAINARMAATFATAKNLRYVDNVLPVLQSIENGAEPTLTAIAKLWGVTPDEIAEYKRICGIIGCLATVRSRHTSSAEWIQKWGALLKPESLKIKSVNELDVILGYDVADLGSVVFRKPEILKTLGTGATKEAVKAEARSFAASKGLEQGSKEFTEAVKRLEDRVDEWTKYDKTYKQWNDRGWIDTTFNYEGNAIPEYRFDADGNVIGKLTGGEKGSFKGFRMVEKAPGSDEFVVQMLDGKTGKWRRITGDIDPVDFTYTDGSPLSPEDHARLIQLLQDSPLGAEHGYTATFKGFMDPATGKLVVKPGPELVKKQFKPNEPALQIAPGDAPSRATRIDVENSRWNDAYDYNMRWVNGFVDAGTKRARGAPQGVDADFDVIPLDAPAQIPLPVKTKSPEPTVGRFIIENGNKGDTAALIMGANGRLQTVLPDGSTEDSPLHDQAFTEGPTETITVAPSSTLQNDPVPDPAPFNLFGFGGGTTPAEAVSSLTAVSVVSRVAVETVRLSAASLDAGSDTIRVSNSPGLAAGATGFEVGQQLAIGTGGDHMELRKVAAVDDGVLTLIEPLEFTHEPGEVVVMVVSAAGVPVDPDKGVDPKPEPDPGTNPGGGTDPGTGTSGGGTPAVPTQVSDTGSGSGTSGSDGATPSGSSGTASGGSSSSGGQPLAYTGTDTPRVIYLGSLLALIGLAFVAAGNRRRRSGFLAGHT